jgi:hypothetical protein
MDGGAAGLVPSGRLSRQEARYRIAENEKKCSVCANYHARTFSCDLVEGNISPDGVCREYELVKKYQDGKDGSFYNDAYRKQQRKLKEARR